MQLTELGILGTEGQQLRGDLGSITYVMVTSKLKQNDPL